MNSEGNRSGPRGSSCCTPESDQIMCSLAIRGVCEPYVNDTSSPANIWNSIEIETRNINDLELLKAKYDSLFTLT